MRLFFHKKHKSIDFLDPIELPKFTVLTGVNGAGKSHLLEALELGYASFEGVPANDVNGLRPTRRFDSTTLVPTDTGAFSSGQMENERSGLWQHINQQKDIYKAGIYQQVASLGMPALSNLDVRSLALLTKESIEAYKVYGDRAEQILASIKQIISNHESAARNNFIQSDIQNRTRFLEAMQKERLDLQLLAMDENDFYANFPTSYHPVDMFQQSFARLFSIYQKAWRENKLKEIGKASGESLEYLTPEQFTSRYGQPPWDFLNEILAAASLSFKVNEPSRYEDRPYEPLLTDVQHGTTVKFNDLSSGERILMSFALCLYHAADPIAAKDFPRVLLLDEIDAPLHPSMTRSLLRTIEKALVEKHGITVILTTHSPSTVALAPEGSLYVMRKSGPNRLQPIARDQALGVLTAGVPSLSVNYENRRQVFVESKYDVQFYSTLYEIVKPSLLPEISLSFIAAGLEGNSNCSQVQDIVEKLVNGGNKTVFGIIDWDTRNNESKSIYVLGKNKRYSIENYLLDPILLAALLLREKSIPPTFLGTNPNISYINFAEFTELDFQKISDTIVSKILPDNTDSNTVEFRYHNGFKITVPSIFAHMQGHELEDKIKNAFPVLKRYHQAPDLKAAVIKIVIDDYPQLVPLSIIEILMRIQKD
jgi:ABC-type branched-subunit amino acid transport system ATPase component